MEELLRENLARAVPDLGVLEEEAERYRLSPGEKQGVLADLERVYYVLWLMKKLGGTSAKDCASAGVQYSTTFSSGATATPPGLPLT
ncbi:hypothetical protein IG193_00570 [Infirmifilum lucidum]|uniref:Uncharacterized protein n=1 Tax=Infirmifilum lucidum TaxID=2776706 RepID=A0A7L9FJ89_9CREN|nr:hypothetical protein [Infirmifilum lucidum]QOJ78994.1 hypothetical protein IG193_00570 [Infirmifilum lucidum]